MARTLEGYVVLMFVFSKRGGRPGRVRFYWWPLVLSIAFSVLLTYCVNR